MTFNNVLNEICKVSTMKATAALSKFLNMPVAFDMKPVEIKNIEKVDLYMDPSDMAVNIFVEINGSIRGASFILWPVKVARNLCDALFHKSKRDINGFREEEISALGELSNIVIGNFLTTFAQSLQMDSLMHKAPIFECGKFEDIWKKTLPKLEEKMTKFVVDISFSFQHVHIKGYVVIIFEEEKIKDVFNKLSVDSST